MGRARQAIESGADDDIPLVDSVRQRTRAISIENIDLPRDALVEVKAINLAVVLLPNKLLDVALLELDTHPMPRLLNGRDPAVAVDLIDALRRLDHFTPPRYP